MPAERDIVRPPGQRLTTPRTLTTDLPCTITILYANAPQAGATTTVTFKWAGASPPVGVLRLDACPGATSHAMK